MSLNTNLQGRLRNTILPKTNVLFPLFEAVANSIYSIDERISKQKDIDLQSGYIRIRINRSPSPTFDNSKAELIGFEIEDNGIGFNLDNYTSFQTLDSTYRSSIGCRGIGRLLWLKVFKKISICSIFRENGISKKRTFDFDAVQEIYNEKLSDVEENIKLYTVIRLENLNKQYSKLLVSKTAKTIVHALLEHCLWYFLRKGGAPKITLQDENDMFYLDDEFDSYMLNSSGTDRFCLKSKEFEITHIKLRTSVQSRHQIVYSAADRVVKEENLSGKISGLYGALTDDDHNNFYYVCFVSSSYLTENVNPERSNFNIPESNKDDVYKDEEISFFEIRNEILKSVSKYLEKYLLENKVKGEKRMQDYITQKAPRYRSILTRIPQHERTVDPNISDKDLDIKLHSHLMDFEEELIREGHDLLKPDNIENIEEYSNKIGDYLSKVSDLKKSDLANYVTHRRVILDLFSEALKKNSEGKYSKENIIHQLIMPMRKTSSEVLFDDYNLWLIDERLAFHDFLASDKTLKSMPITNSDLVDRPDIIALNVYDNPLLVSDGQKFPLASFSIIELKRPMRDDAKEGEDKDPIEQCLNYLEKIRNGTVCTKNGRPIPNSKDIPGFCYIICDLTESIIKRCKMLNLQITSDMMGYFGYNDNYKAYIEVISFDRLLNMAKERNRAFFDKLGLPSN